MLGNEYHVIKTAADVHEFQNVSNGLHDGYITHVEYSNTGISAHDNCLTFDYTGTSLFIHVLVTSLPGHPSFEISFHNVTELLQNQSNTRNFNKLIYIKFKRKIDRIL